MKKQLLIISFLSTMLFLKAQTEKTYTGAFTANGAEGIATYKYTEDPTTGSRIFNGKFSYSGKYGGVKLTETIEGNYKNDLKNGLWVYNTKTVPGIRTVADQKFYGSYKDGFPDGAWVLNSVTKFITGTQLQGNSLTGTSITITGIANYKNKHLFGDFQIENKQTGENTKPYSAKGNFDENGLMDGKWTIKFTKQMNDAITEETRDYKNGILTHIRQLNSQTGETTNDDYSDNLKILSSHEPITGLFVSSDNKLYTLDTIGAEGYQDAAYVLSLASGYFCKGASEDHYHKNTKGCLGCWYFKTIKFRQVDDKQIADQQFRKREFKKSAKMYELLIKADSPDKEVNYTNLSWVNCLIGNFQENVVACNEALKVATGNNKSNIQKNLAHSYLLNNQYDEAKKSYFQFANGNFTFLEDLLNKDLDTLKNLGFYNPNCDMIKIEVKEKIIEKERIAKEKKASMDMEFARQKKAKEMPSLVSSKHQDFDKLYIELKEVPFFVDDKGKPLTKKTYPKGKNIYEKGEQVYQAIYTVFEAEKDSDKIISMGDDIIKLLDKLISIASTDTKDLDKAIKKTETTEDIKKILGL